MPIFAPVVRFSMPRRTSSAPPGTVSPPRVTAGTAPGSPAPASSGPAREVSGISNPLAGGNPGGGTSVGGVLPRPGHGGEGGGGWPGMGSAGGRDRRPGLASVPNSLSGITRDGGSSYGRGASRGASVLLRRIRFS